MIKRVQFWTLTRPWASRRWSVVEKGGAGIRKLGSKHSRFPHFLPAPSLLTQSDGAWCTVQTVPSLLYTPLNVTNLITDTQVIWMLRYRTFVFPYIMNIWHHWTATSRKFMSDYVKNKRWSGMLLNLNHPLCGCGSTTAICQQFNN